MRSEVLAVRRLEPATRAQNGCSRLYMPVSSRYSTSDGSGCDMLLKLHSKMLLVSSGDS